MHSLGGEHLFCLDEHRSVILNGAPYVQLAPFLDGCHSLLEIASALQNRLGLPQIYFCLNELGKRGLLLDGEGCPGREDAPFFEFFDGNAEAIDDRRKNLTVTVEAVGGCSPDPVKKAVEAAGLRVGRNGDFFVVATDDYLRPELADVNARMLDRKLPWMLVKPVGMVPWIGPILQPGETGCWECLAQRLRMNRQMQRYIRERTGRIGPVVTSRPIYPAAEDLSCDLAGIEILKWLISPGTSRLYGKLLSLDLFWRKSQEHVLVRRPQCRACRNGAEPIPGGPAPVVPVSRKKTFCEDGGHRTLSPEQTYERFKRHVSPILGAVSEL
ncbi:MAG: TOMM precursor leader peptide-binding protein, partial [Desulfobacteraceae bacterium]|nr:TOMM precursor leader peptide-binding protein [Desulfobacteraceae bacterium]